MKNKLIRILCVCLTVPILCAAITGCSSRGNQAEKSAVEPMEVEEADSLSFDIIGGRDVMPIAGFVGPTANLYCKDGYSFPDMLNDKYFQDLVDAGVNMVTYNQTYYGVIPTQTMKMLDLGEKYGIGMFVFDDGISQKLGEKMLTIDEIAERMNNYANHPAFCGLHVVDEPSFSKFDYYNAGSDIEVYAPIYQMLAEIGVVAYNNLFPTYITEDTSVYPEYLETFLSSCNVKYLSYDYYVFDEKPTVEDYFYNMSVVREKADKYHIPFWTFIQAGSGWNDAEERFDTESYYPNEAQFDWNVNTCLAYGAKGIQYFPLIQPRHFAYAKSKEWDFERNGLIGAAGNKNRWYYYAQNINKQIAAVDEVLMNSVSKGVLLSGEQAVRDNKKSSCVIEGTSWRELKKVTGNALIGCFNYQGKTALYVVNYDMEYAQEIQLDFQEECKVSVIQNAEKNYYSGNGIKLNMQAGEGSLIVFE